MTAVASAAGTLLPRSFGRYLLFDFVGKGGMAEIYLARQKTDLGATRLCVVKQILPGLAGDPQFSDMLVHEAKLAARLNHANVVQVFDLGRADGRLFIAMEYVEGFDLNDLLKRCSRAKVPMPFELAVHVLREALRGLDYAHRRSDDAGAPFSIVHRDVSPSNLLLSFEGEVKVCDFGIAHANDRLFTSGEHEMQEALRGKAGYMSPEHARGEGIDARADVFAAGIILWELAAGRRLYKTDDGRGTLLEQARAAVVPELPKLGLPQEAQLQSIVSKALAKEKDARYPSAGAMLRDLEGYAASARLMTSPLQLGDWLERTFGEEILERRRARERAAAALERGAPVVVQPITEAKVATPAPAPAAAAGSSPVALGTVDLGPPSSQTKTPLAKGEGQARKVVWAVAMVALVVVAAIAVLMLARR